MRKFIAYLFVFLCMAGCTLPHNDNILKLDRIYRPLKEIRERTDGGGKGLGWVETIGEYVYTEDLDGLLNIYRPGDVEFHALMLHEQVHSKRQGTGLSLLWWMFNYNVIPGEKWEEEKVAWEVQLRHLKDNGATIYRPGVFDSLTSYDMASEEEINRWLDKILDE